jgi:peptidoglycan/LPS O-acetylase OafA/YrhL
MFYNIQGLRAFAVISVIFFHYQITFFSGGFLGVDIFFVISGYLMTLILDKKINFKEIIEFYLRRIRRLLPALLFVIILSLILGFLLMSDTSFERLGKTSLSSIFFTSNLFFWREWGYFDLYSNNKPLLHTWSLSLEIQFYFIFPLLLFFVHLFLKRIQIIYKLIIIFIALNIFTEFFIDEKNIATFYLLPFRISEFLLGSIGYYYEKNNKTSNIQSNYLFIICFILLIFFIFYYHKTIRFPGLNTIPICFVSILLILNKKSYLTKFIFENKLILFIGNISYSLFLVHWPIFVFYRFYKFNEPSNIEKILLIIFSILIAFLLNKYIENYFKKELSRKNNLKLFFSFLTTSIFCFLIIFNNGYNFRIQNTESLKSKIENLNRNFFEDFDKNKLFYKKCEINSKKKIIDFILFGDSHAQMYTQSFINFSKKYDKNFCFVSSPVSCNFLKSYKDKNFVKSNCKKRNEMLVNFFSKEKFSNLIISNAWFTLGQKDLEKIKIRYENFYEKAFPNQQKNILFILNVPEFSNGISMEQCSGFPRYIIKKRNCYSAPRNSIKIKENDNINKTIQFQIQNSNKGNIFFFNPYDFLCDTIKCKQVINDNDVYVDQDHLSVYSSNLIINFWNDKLLNLMR